MLNKRLPKQSLLKSSAMNALFGKDDVPVIGILGGGQLCMMMVEAAHRMGCKVAVLDPNSACSARSVLSHSDSFLCGSFTSQEDISKFVEQWYASTPCRLRIGKFRIGRPVFLSLPSYLWLFGFHRLIRLDSLLANNPPCSELASR